MVNKFLEFLKDLNFDVTVIDPREYFITKQKFQNIKSSTTVLDQQEEDEEYYFEIEFDDDE